LRDLPPPAINFPVVNPPRAGAAPPRSRGRGPATGDDPRPGKKATPAQIERQRRLKQRALPLLVVAVIAFVVGMVSAAGSAEQDMAERFVDAWAAQDFKAMHEELTNEAQSRFKVEQLAAAYQEAQLASTTTAIDPGGADGPKDRDGTEVVEAEVGIRTALFGRIDGVVALPVEDEKVAWAPHLTFPGLAEGERVGRRLTLPDRAPILAKDGAPLATGQGLSRGSPRLGSAAIDVTGEVGAADSERQAALEKQGYPGDQNTGISGLELAFNSELAGRPGGELLAVREGTPLPDVPKGAEGRVLATAQQQPGAPLQTTIDARLQGTTVDALGGQSGGIAVLDARTGEVRSLAGSAFSSPQPPGSTFKVVTTTAGLEANKVKLGEQFPVVTEINPDPVNGARVIDNAHDEPCGGSFVEAFAKSCNTVFAPLGVRIGAQKIVEEAEQYGWNQPTTLYDAKATAATDPGRMTMPTNFESDTSHTNISVTAIGQGEVLATPLGMASVAQTIANGGTRSPTPIVTDPKLQADAGPVEVTSTENARVLTSLMRGVVSNGTGTAAALPKTQVAGKTGTAELGPKPNQPPARAVGPGEEPPEPEQIIDAWFIAFAPAQKPKLAIAVMLIDADGDGGEVAAPIAQDILGSVFP
jgi:Penicillin binding protein transpeptidase domain/Penicillin-binding Protein dimerisation domain/NTF2-like N-terminal transpeptidase domain